MQTKLHVKLPFESMPRYVLVASLAYLRLESILTSAYPRKLLYVHFCIHHAFRLEYVKQVLQQKLDHTDIQ